MKIIYDNVSSEYIYPLSKKDITLLKECVPLGVIERIKSIRFGCNNKTTQEGRLIQYGHYYDIRINFCLNNMRSLILSEGKKYLDQIKYFGGIVDLSKRHIIWKLDNAKKYMLFLVFHELGHIIYCDTFLNGKMESRSSSAEEHWCDKYALEKVDEYYIRRQ